MKTIAMVALFGLGLVTLSGCEAREAAPIASVPSPPVVEVTTPAPLEELAMSVYCEDAGNLIETVGDVTTITPDGC